MKKPGKPHKHRLPGLFDLVGVTGLEPMASWSRTKRDTKLRHTPKCFSIILYRSDKIKWYFDFLLNVFNF